MPGSLADEEVLVTGGAGFLGSHLARKAVNLGARVTICDNLREGSLGNIRDLRKHVKLVREDIVNAQAVERVIKDKAYVFHFAGNASMPKSVENPTFDMQNNLIGTYNVLKSIVDNESETTLLFSSSAAVYGEPKKLPMREDHPLNPVSPYGTSKLAAEEYCRLFTKLYGLRSVCLRFFNVYGPDQTRNIHHDVMKKIVNSKETLQMLGTGKEVRDFVHIDDAIDATLKLAEQSKTFSGMAINVGRGIGTSIDQLVRIFLNVLQCEREVAFEGRQRKGDISALIAENGRLQRAGKTNFRPLENGIREFAEHWLAKNRAVLHRKSLEVIEA